jgi:uncharacterized protein YbjT (DUF2867 family)
MPTVLNAGTTDQEAASMFFTAAARNLHEAGERAGVRQFHEFAGQMLEWGRRGDVVYVPRMRTQPVAVRVVAEALADLATGVPGSERRAELTEIAGPQEEQLVDMVARLAARRGDPVRVEGVADPNDPDRDLVKAGALLPGPAATLAGPTFQEWLDALGQS